jgi:hypothetical protein
VPGFPWKGQFPGCSDTMILTPEPWSLPLAWVKKEVCPGVGLSGL